MERHYPGGAWVAPARRHARGAARGGRLSRGLPSSTPAWPSCWRRADDGRRRSRSSLGSLLYEGYALYPYTPGAAKNATPTPFGIVYPPAYARRRRRLRPPAPVECIACAEPATRSDGRGALPAVRPASAPPGGRAAARRLRAQLGERPSAARRAVRRGCAAGRVRLSADDLGDGRWRVTLCVHNTTPVSDGLDRGEALRRACSRRTRRCGSTAAASSRRSRRRAARERQHLPGARDARRRRAARRRDRAARPPAARAREPRRPLRRRPRSRRRCCSTCTRSATASATEIAAADPAVRAMIERAAAATPEDILAPARRVTVLGPSRDATAARRGDPARREVDRRRRHLPAAATRSCCASSRPRPLRPHARRPRSPTLERIYVDYDDSVYLGVTVDDDPVQDADARDRPVPVLLRRRGGGVRAHDEPPRSRSSSPASATRGCSDDGFGGEVRAGACASASCPRASRVADFGTGGLDLAYEVMRGYDALVLVDVSRQGGEPGHAVRDGGPTRRTSTAGDRGRRDDRPARHGSRRRCCASCAPSAAGRARWSSIACEPARGRGGRASGSAAAGRRRPSTDAVGLVVETVRARRSVHELSLASAVVDTVERHADGRRVTAVTLRSGHLRQVVPDSLEFYFGHVARGTVCEGARLRARARPGARCAAAAATSGSSTRSTSAARPAAAPASRWSAARSFGSSRSTSRSRSRHAPREGQGRRGRARRQQHDRAAPTAPTSTAHGVTVVNLMSAPGRGQDDAARARCSPTGSTASASACSRATSQGSLDADRLARLHVPVTQINTDRGLRRRVPPRRQHGALGAAVAAARRDRPAHDRERRQPRLPGRVPRRRGRARDGLARSPRARTSRSSTR